jgi:hypothetical protein
MKLPAVWLPSGKSSKSSGRSTNGMQQRLPYHIITGPLDHSGSIAKSRDTGMRMVRGIKLLALAILWLVPLVTISLALHHDWASVWSAMKVPTMNLPFSDLRVITGGLKTQQLGGNPITDNVGESLHRPMNYPRIWLHLFSRMGITDSNIEIVGIVFCVLYLICVSWLVLQCTSVTGVLVLLIAALSVAPLFAIERGNTDLLIFTLVFLGWLAGNQFLRPGAFFAAAALKIYPFAALIVEAIRRPVKGRIVPLALAGLVIALFAWQWRDFNAIRHSTPISPTLSYGLLSLKAQAAYMSRKFLLFNCVAAGAIAAIAWLSRPNLEESLLNSKVGQLFSIFAGIYVFTFAIGSSWNYRLIFLLPTLPLAIELVRTPQRGWWGIAYIATVLIAENSSARGLYQATPLGDAATWAIFVALLPILLKQARGFLFARNEISTPASQAANSTA